MTQRKDEKHYVPVTNIISQALLNEVLSAIIAGNYHRCVSYGLNPENIKRLQNLTPLMLSKLNCSAALWAKFKIDNRALHRLINQAETDIAEDELINSIIQLGGSNTLLNRYFGIYSGEIATRRKLLNIPVSKGRNISLTNEQKDQVWKIWNTFIKNEPEEGYSAIEQLLTIKHIAERLTINISSIWHELSLYKALTINDDELKETNEEYQTQGDGL